jgi:DNA-binding MarR family transcriptional regulator
MHFFANLDDHVAHLLRRAHQRASSVLMTAIEDHRLTPTQCFAICRLHEYGSISQNHLGRLAAMDPATIQGVIQRLYDRGLIQRDRDDSDRRRIMLSLTPRGEQLCATLYGQTAQAHDSTLEPLSEDERQSLAALLRKIG